MKIPTHLAHMTRNALLGTLALGALGTLSAFAQETAPVVAAAAEPVPDKGDTAWMLVSTLLVLFMALPGSRSSMAGWCAPRTCFRCSCSAR